MIISNSTEKSVVQLHVNGETHDVVIRSADTLLYAIREQIGLTGAKRSCGTGDCGACDVIINGETMHSCLCLAIETVNQPITTVEGLKNSPVQKAFVDNWAIQCGFCTPGFIVNCHALMTTHPNASEEVVKEWLQSNLCRCTGYQEIRDAMNSVLHKGNIAKDG